MVGSLTESGDRIFYNVLDTVLMYLFENMIFKYELQNECISLLSPEI